MQALLVGGEHRVGVGAKNHVEQAALGGLRNLDHAREIFTGVGVRLRMPPRRDVMAAGTDEHPDLDLVGAWAHGGAPFLAADFARLVPVWRTYQARTAFIRNAGRRFPQRPAASSGAA